MAQVCKWAHGVMVSHPLRMRKALGSNPSGSISFFPNGTQRAYDALVWPCANRIVCIPRTIGCKHCARACSRRRTKHASCGTAAIAQLGERQTEDLKVPGSIPGLGTLLCARITASRGCKSCCLALGSRNIFDASLFIAVNWENH